MTEKNYDIVLCPTEADVLIAAECRPRDVVVTCDSDLLFYRTVLTVWRPVGSYKARRFVPYEKPAVLKALSLSSTQLTALAILSGNDYCCNIPYLAIDTNHKIVKNLHGDETSVIRQYLSHPQVKRRTDKGDAKWSVESYASAIKVFVDLKQTVASESASPSLAANGDNVATNSLSLSDNGTTAGSAEASLTDNPTVKDNPARDTRLSFLNLLERMKCFMHDFEACKTEAYEARVAKRAARSSQSKPQGKTKAVNPYATIDKPGPDLSHKYRPRFSPKLRFEPPTLLTPAKKKPSPLKAEIGEDSRFERKQILDALSFEHPTVTLDVNLLSKNVSTAVKKVHSSSHIHSDTIAKAITDCIRGAVKVAWEIKRYCQQLIGLYLEDLFYPRVTPGGSRGVLPVPVIGQQDRTIIDELCPRLSSKEMNDGEDDHTAEDGRDVDSNTPFIHSFLTFLYSGNRPRDSKVGSAVNNFIDRLQEMGHLEKSKQK
ncbi:hypothetical protein BGZ98_005340, partial [Dissophora globulifera]